MYTYSPTQLSSTFKNEENLAFVSHNSGIPNTQIRNSNMALPETMRAVVMNGNFNVAVEDRPTPKVQHSKDAIIRVTLSGLCGSDLHYYRGYEHNRVHRSKMFDHE